MTRELPGVRLSDRFDNKSTDAQTRRVREALYAGHVILEPGATIDLAGLRVYYRQMTRSSEFADNVGAGAIDSVGGGMLIRCSR